MKTKGWGVLGMFPLQNLQRSILGKSMKQFAERHQTESYPSCPLVQPPIRLAFKVSNKSSSRMKNTSNISQQCTFIKKMKSIFGILIFLHPWEIFGHSSSPISKILLWTSISLPQRAGPRQAQPQPSQSLRRQRKGLLDAAPIAAFFAPLSPWWDWTERCFNWWIYDTLRKNESSEKLLNIFNSKKQKNKSSEKKN